MMTNLNDIAAGAALYVAPLWPAGHLPLKGGDQLARRLTPISSVADEAIPTTQLISPLEGEMAGRPEGGVLAYLLAAKPRNIGREQWAR